MLCKTRSICHVAMHVRTNLIVTSWLCSVLHIANKCLEEDVAVFKYGIQDIVDELEASFWLSGPCVTSASSSIGRATATSLVPVQEMRKTCKLSNHKALVSRLLFILTRCSRLVLSGKASSQSCCCGATCYRILSKLHEFLMQFLVRPCFVCTVTDVNLQRNPPRSLETMQCMQHSRAIGFIRSTDASQAFL